jgi:hypothetical protein
MGRIRPAADLVMLRQQLCTVAGLAEVNADRLIGSARTRTVGIDARGQ